MQPHTQNRLISSLTSQSRDLLLTYSVPVELPLKTILYRAEETPSHAYFITAGMVSIVTTMEDGETAEVGVIGNEGVVGGIFSLGAPKGFDQRFHAIGRRGPSNSLFAPSTRISDFGGSKRPPSGVCSRADFDGQSDRRM